MALKDIETIVIVILENRSFDHTVGYLSLATANPPMALDGLRDDDAWVSAHANDFNGESYPVHPFTSAVQTIEDPPHNRADIRTQITTPPHSGPLDMMGGFVKSYNSAHPSDRSRVMGYYKKEAVPTFDFFARNFRICDRWFAPLPSGTQPNRLMAMSGESQIYDNVAHIWNFPNQYLVYDWLTANGISWCAYQWRGNPFFVLMSSWRWKILLSLNDPIGLGRFRYYNNFAQHWKAGGPIPSVVFIEPEYTDDLLPADPNDDHPPTGIANGQKFLADIYSTLISNPSLWEKTMMIATYDEHGGFFDHVPPLEIPTEAGGYPFTTTGPRVPAFVISPQVAPGTVFHSPLDHTSILQLLADRFTPGKDYSAAVAARQQHLVRLSTILLDQPPAKAPSPKIPAVKLAAVQKSATAATAAASPAGATSSTETAQAFREVAEEVALKHPDLLLKPKASALTKIAAFNVLRQAQTPASEPRVEAATPRAKTPARGKARQSKRKR
jgi:phospholipase C